VTESFPEDMTPEQADALRAQAQEQLRRRVAAVRRTLPAALRSSHAAAACRLLIEHPAFRAAQLVLAYSALRFELDPRDAIEQAWALGKAVGLPRTVPDTRQLALHSYHAGDELLESGFVVKEPLPSAPALAASDVDLVLVPGLAFDTRGQRLGYGQGYYDRLLPSLPRALRIGLAFELSLLAEVPSTAHDVPVDLLITERRVIPCAR
jgi:5-formyltetrahydrofolate cyclo-ligase